MAIHSASISYHILGESHHTATQPQLCVPHYKVSHARSRNLSPTSFDFLKSGCPPIICPNIKEFISHYSVLWLGPLPFTQQDHGRQEANLVTSMFPTATNNITGT